MMINVGPAIKLRRKQNGITQAELADQVCVSTDVISRIERGVQEPTFMLVCSIARTLDCSLDELAYDINT